MQIFIGENFVKFNIGLWSALEVVSGAAAATVIIILFYRCDRVPEKLPIMIFFRQINEWEIEEVNFPGF